MLKLYVYCSILLLVLCMGCQTDREFSGNETESGRLVLNYSLQKDIPVKSSITPEEHENRIQSLFIFFFEYSTDQSGKLLNIYNVPLQAGGVYSEIGSIPIELTHEDYYNIEASGQYNLLITANSEYYTRANDYSGDKQDLDALRIYFLDLWKGRTEEQIAQNAYLRLDNNKIDPGRLPMSGKAIKTAGNHEINVVLKRGVSRLDIEVEDKNYQLVSAAVYNVFSRTNVWDNTKATYQDDDYKNMETVSAEGKNHLKGNLYVFENYVPSPQQNDKTTTCIIAGLQRIQNENGEKITGETEYFRINMHPPKRMQHLKRNNTYRYLIREVLGDGEDSEFKAYANGNQLIDGTINGWETEKFGDIVFDENNILAVSFAGVYFGPQGGTATVDIFTHGPGEPEIDASRLPDNIFADLKDKKLVITAKKSNSEQEGIIEVKFANLHTSILIEQRSEKNDKIQLSHQTIEAFPPIIADQDSSQRIKVTATGKWTAKLYNNPYKIVNGNDTVYHFSFDKENKLHEIKSTPTEGYTTIYLHQNNETDKAIYSFVMFSLEDNPAVSQVLLLTQRTAKVIVSDNYIVFDQEGYVSYPQITGNTYYSIGIKASPGWEVEVREGKDFFKHCISESDSLYICAKPNETNRTKRAVFRVCAAESKAFFQDITVLQDVHTLSLDPESGFSPISSGGGETKVITVKGTGNWTAVIQTYPEDHPATLIRVDAQTEEAEKESNKQISGIPGDKFKVRFPKVNTPFIVPTATVTITVDGTSVGKTIEFRQNALVPAEINFHSWGNNNIALYTDKDGIYQSGLFINIAQALRNPGMFGPKGTVDIPKINFSGIPKGSPQIETDTHIYQTGKGEKASKPENLPENITAEHAGKIYSWLFKSKSEWVNPHIPERKPDRIYFFMQDKDAPVSIQVLINANVLPETYKDIVKTANFEGQKKDYYDVDFKEYMTNPLMRFLLRTGPFSTQLTSELETSSYLLTKKIRAYIENWPPTFYPVIVDLDGKCYLGVDPTNQFVFMGDDMFFDDIWNYDNGAEYNENDYNNFPPNMQELYSTHRKQLIHRTEIMNNLMAWMLYVGAYGEDFLKDFK
ncbi:MAG: hypothetical protein LUH10_05940 [Tannerellaceae bacterium]|nr:hypothetical protein [Tannerellaceae bacterium]